MSEETKSDKQLLLAEHKKANDALRELKNKAISQCYYEEKMLLNDEGEWYLSPARWHMYITSDKCFEEIIAPISTYLRIQFERIMKSNKKIKTIEYKPLHTKNLTDKKPIKVFGKKDIKMKKAMKKKAPVKKPAAKKPAKGKK